MQKNQHIHKYIYEYVLINSENDYRGDFFSALGFNGDFFKRKNANKLTINPLAFYLVVMVGESNQPIYESHL
jgi:hypothetical protein